MPLVSKKDQPCPTCLGSGRTYTDADHPECPLCDCGVEAVTCSDCDGSGVDEARRTAAQLDAWNEFCRAHPAEKEEAR